jgi:hypothetical protein
MRAFLQVLGGVLLGLGSVSVVGLDPGLLFAGYTVGLGMTLLVIAGLMVEDPPAEPGGDGHEGSRGLPGP